MIKYMKALITSGELDETEINKLKEQITLINTNIDTMMNDQIIPIKQNIERIEQGMNAIDKVMPTDINVDSNGNLILEHDGQEITGQKKQVAIYTKEQVDALISGGGGKQLFRHMISIYADEDTLGFIFEYITDNNLKVDSIQDLNTITHAGQGTIILCSAVNAGQHFSLNTNANGLMYDGSNWYYGFVMQTTIYDETLLTITSISDVVTTV